MKKIIEISLLLFLILWIRNSYTVNKDAKTELESLLQKCDDYLLKDFFISLQYAEKAHIIAERVGDHTSNARSYYYMARCFLFFEEFAKYDFYMKKAIKEYEKSNVNDPTLEMLLESLKIYYYSKLHLYKQLNDQCFKVLNLSSQRNDTESILISSFSYMALGDYYTDINKYKFANSFLDKSLKESDKVSDQQYLYIKKVYKIKAFIYYHIANSFLLQHNIDSAYPYVKKSYQQAIKDDISYLHIFLELYGDYYLQTKEYDKALEYYLKAADLLKKIYFSKKTASTLYLKISLVYGELKNPEKENYYLKQSSIYRISDEKSSRVNTQYILNQIEEDSQKNIQQNRGVWFFTTTLIVIYLVIILLLEYRKNKIKAIDIIKKDQNLEAKKSEIEQLERKVNESFPEIIQLAKDNSPWFWTRFQEVYPFFTKKMLEINPNFKSSELSFCAYIYLGFTTKEISTYTFKAIKTIENNRYNLRKKLYLSPEKDLLIWLRSYIDS